MFKCSGNPKPAVNPVTAPTNTFRVVVMPSNSLSSSAKASPDL